MLTNYLPKVIYFFTKNFEKPKTIFNVKSLYSQINLIPVEDH